MNHLDDPLYDFLAEILTKDRKEQYQVINQHHDDQPKRKDPRANEGLRTKQ